MATSCAEQSCSRPPFRRGWCTMHYSRIQRHGDPSDGWRHRTCLNCGAAFIAERSRALYCTRGCGEQYRTFGGPPDPNRPCSECGESIGERRREAKTCSTRCARRRTNRLARESGRKREQRTRRRAAEAYDGAILAEAVFERDGWLCGLCGDPVDRAAAVPDPVAPVLDHIIPLALGGRHEWSNVQCAHWRCNLSKSSRAFRGAEQLRLIPPRAA